MLVSHPSDSGLSIDLEYPAYPPDFLAWEEEAKLHIESFVASCMEELRREIKAPGVSGHPLSNPKVPFKEQERAICLILFSMACGAFSPLLHKPTGGGKTVTSLGLIYTLRRLQAPEHIGTLRVIFNENYRCRTGLGVTDPLARKLPIIVFVDRIELVRQWTGQENCEGKLNCYGKHPNFPLTYATITQNPKADAQEVINRSIDFVVVMVGSVKNGQLLSDAFAVIADECHKLSSYTAFRKSVQKLSGTSLLFSKIEDSGENAIDASVELPNAWSSRIPLIGVTATPFNALRVTDRKLMNALKGGDCNWHWRDGVSTFEEGDIEQHGFPILASTFNAYIVVSTFGSLVKERRLVKPVYVRLTSKEMEAEIQSMSIDESIGDWKPSDVADFCNHPEYGEYIASALLDNLVTKGEDGIPHCTQSLLFCGTVAQASHLEAELHRVWETQYGILPNGTMIELNVAIVTGGTPAEERRETVKNFQNGAIRIVLNCGCLKEGYDYPGLPSVALCVPVRSPNGYIQMAGRGARTSPGKTHFSLFDFGSIVTRLGELDEAYSQPPRFWRPRTPVPSRVCLSCGAEVPVTAITCPSCGTSLLTVAQMPQIQEPVKAGQLNLSFITSKPLTRALTRIRQDYATAVGIWLRDNSPAPSAYSPEKFVFGQNGYPIALKPYFDKLFAPEGVFATNSFLTKAALTYWQAAYKVLATGCVDHCSLPAHNALADLSNLPPKIDALLDHFSLPVCAFSKVFYDGKGTELGVRLRMQLACYHKVTSVLTAIQGVSGDQVQSESSLLSDLFYIETSSILTKPVREQWHQWSQVDRTLLNFCIHWAVVLGFSSSKSVDKKIDYSDFITQCKKNLNGSSALRASTALDPRIWQPHEPTIVQICIENAAKNWGFNIEQVLSDIAL